MELKIQVEYDQILKLVKQLPPNELAKLKSALDTNENAQLPIFKSISTKQKTYQLNTPLICSIEKEEDGFIVESEILSVVGSGASINAAIEDFSQEFDYLYNKLQSLEESQLSSKLRKCKDFFSLIIKSIA